MRFLPSIFGALLLVCACANRGISEKQYAHFSARKALLEGMYGSRPDTLAAYMKGLYQTEKITPEQILAFAAKMDKTPEKWAEVQQKVVTELEKLQAEPGKKRGPSIDSKVR